VPILQRDEDMRDREIALAIGGALLLVLFLGGFGRPGVWACPWGAGYGGYGGLLWILALGALGVLLFYAFTEGAIGQKDVLSIVKERLARGEITHAEYEEILGTIKDNSRRG